MSTDRCRYLAVLLSIGSLGALPIAHADPIKTQPGSSQGLVPSNAIDPQVVRLSYVDGDVRVARGKVDGKPSGTDWEVAVTGLPIVTGFSVATGEGRAVIEFEDASTLYLAPNSVLAFNDIHSTGTIPYTKLALLTGTATLHVRRSDGDLFVLETPTARLIAGYHGDTYMRVSSFTDGFAFSARKNLAVHLPDSAQPVTEPADGKTVYYRGSSRIAAPDTAEAQDFTAWDQWVDQRVTERSAAQAEVMKQAGLTSPIPGLTDLAGKGSFFSCEPYGTCWEPTEQAGAGEQASAAPVAEHGSGPYSPMLDPGFQYGQSASPWQASPMLNGDPWDLFPCAPDRLRMLMSYYAAMGYYGGPLASPLGMPYDWARCHAGSWINHRGHYAWVVGRRIHHHPPVHWIRYGSTKAFVPIHPRDEAGKLPLNREHGIFVTKGGGVKLVSVDPREEMKPLETPPKEFSKPVAAHLERAAGPAIELHSVRASLNPSLVKGPGELRSTLTFDHKSQSFLVARQFPYGGRTITVREPYVGHNGALQARVAGLDSHGNYSMHASTASGSGGFRGGGAASGGGMRGGGSVSSSGGGGGGHFSGSGGVSSGPVSSGGSSSAGASSGGSHH